MDYNQLDHLALIINFADVTDIQQCLFLIVICPVTLKSKSILSIEMKASVTYFLYQFIHVYKQVVNAMYECDDQYFPIGS